MAEDYEAQKERVISSFTWLLSKAFTGNIPKLYANIVAENQGKEWHITQEMVAEMVSGDLYSTACDNIFSDSDDEWTEFGMILSNLVMRGHEAVDVRSGEPLVASQLESSEPFLLSAHLGTLDAIMAATVEEVATSERVMKAVRAFCGWAPSLDSEPFSSSTEGVFLWLTAVVACAIKQLNIYDSSQWLSIYGEEESTDQPTDPFLANLTLADQLALLVNFYSPDLAPAESFDFNFSDMGTLPLTSTIHNAGVVHEFCSKQLPVSPWHLPALPQHTISGLDPIPVVCRPRTEAVRHLELNVAAMLTEFFYWMEVRQLYQPSYRLYLTYGNQSSGQTLNGAPNVSGVNFSTARKVNTGSPFDLSSRGSDVRATFRLPRGSRSPMNLPSLDRDHQSDSNGVTPTADEVASGAATSRTVILDGRASGGERGQLDSLFRSTAPANEKAGQRGDSGSKGKRPVQATYSKTELDKMRAAMDAAGDGGDSSRVAETVRKPVSSNGSEPLQPARTRPPKERTAPEVSKRAESGENTSTKVRTVSLHGEGRTVSTKQSGRIPSSSEISRSEEDTTPKISLKQEFEKRKMMRQQQDQQQKLGQQHPSCSTSKQTTTWVQQTRRQSELGRRGSATSLSSLTTSTSVDSKLGSQDVTPELSDVKIRLEQKKLQIQKERKRTGEQVTKEREKLAETAFFQLVGGQRVQSKVPGDDMDRPSTVVAEQVRPVDDRKRRERMSGDDTDRTSTVVAEQVRPVDDRRRRERMSGEDTSTGISEKVRSAEERRKREKMDKAKSESEGSSGEEEEDEEEDVREIKLENDPATRLQNQPRKEDSENAMDMLPGAPHQVFFNPLTQNYEYSIDRLNNSLSELQCEISRLSLQKDGSSSHQRKGSLPAALHQGNSPRAQPAWQTQTPASSAAQMMAGYYPPYPTAWAYPGVPPSPYFPAVSQGMPPHYGMLPPHMLQQQPPYHPSAKEILRSITPPPGPAASLPSNGQSPVSPRPPPSRSEKDVATVQSTTTTPTISVQEKNTNADNNSDLGNPTAFFVSMGDGEQPAKDQSERATWQKPPATKKSPKAAKKTPLQLAASDEPLEPPAPPEPAPPKAEEFFIALDDGYESIKLRKKPPPRLTNRAKKSAPDEKVGGVEKEVEVKKPPMTPQLKQQSSQESPPPVKQRPTTFVIGQDVTNQRTPGKPRQKSSSRPKTFLIDEEDDMEPVFDDLSPGAEDRKPRPHTYVIGDELPYELPVVDGEEVKSPSMAFVLTEETLPEVDEDSVAERQRERISEMQHRRERERQAKLRELEKEKERQRQIDLAKQREKDEKKGQEKQRREAIYQAYMQRKSESEVGEEGGSVSGSNPVVLRRRPGSQPRQKKTPSSVNRRSAAELQNVEAGSTVSSVEPTALVLAPPTTKLFVQPKGKSNRGVIANAVSYCCLAGTVNEPVKVSTLKELERADGSHFMILFRGGNQYRSLYTFNHELEDLHKICGNGPKRITNDMVHRFFKYNSGAKKFTEITSTKHMSTVVDAVMLHPSLWKGGPVPTPTLPGGGPASHTTGSVSGASASGSKKKAPSRGNTK